jgi:hypothetical protein
MHRAWTASWASGIFKSDSVKTVQKLVDAATSKVSRNEFYALNERNALGLAV